MDKWVSTVDKLPDFNMMVIICIDGNHVWSGKFTSFGWFEYASVGCVEIQKYCKVTHWMPLPEPPK